MPLAIGLFFELRIIESSVGICCVNYQPHDAQSAGHQEWPCPSIPCKVIFSNFRILIKCNNFFTKKLSNYHLRIYVQRLVRQRICSTSSQAID